MANNPIWPIGQIHNAAQVPLSGNPGTLPNMSDDVANWFQLLVFEKLVKTTTNFVVVEMTTPIQFQGVIFTPTTGRRLVMATNGQRLWKAKQVITWPGVLLAPDDVVTYEGIQYRVMVTGDFKQYGFASYDLCEDYIGSGPTVNP